ITNAKSYILPFLSSTIYTKLDELTLNLTPGITWNYAAGGGRINMGSFEITCRLANQIATAYGLGKSEPTNVTFSAGEVGRPAVRSFNIPILDITGDKVPRWVSFVQGFQPVRR
ncbi:hypothetical protein QUA78_21405, partial [Microcoleus sp. K4-B3]